jgi:glycosyltransferase involved in cell wall biosynthesis
VEYVNHTESLTHAEAIRFALIIPAYRPSEILLRLIGALSEKPIPVIVLVDDGSGPDYREIFCRAAQFEKVRVVRHAVNLGKGAALKTGINYALCAFPELQGVITADADGQHHPDDIQQVADRLGAEPDRVILGTRTFSSSVPLRSRVGNLLTRTVMRALVGQHISDTQTGLRGIPARLLPRLLRLEANGYDFELDMLIAVRQQALRISEVPIRTIYEPGNRTSHFNPLIDSMKIYFVLLRFSWVSLMTAALDTLVFYLAYRRLGNLAASQALGRILAVAFNYTMVRRAVFFSKLRHASVLPKYLLLVCLSGTASYAGIQLLGSRFHIQPLPAKLLVESLLFFANFAIQRDFIFGKSREEPRPQRVQPAWIERVPGWIPRAVVATLACALLGMVLYGFHTQSLWPNAGWTEAGRQRLMHYTTIYWAVSLVIWLIAPVAFAPIVAMLIVGATAVAIGPLAVLAVAAFLISACAVGSKLLGASDDSFAESQLCCTLLGIAVYIFLMAFLARLPVNYPAVYAALLAIPVLLDIRGVARRLASWGRALVRPRPRSRPRVAAFVLLVFVLGIHWLIVPQPEASADGLAMHLAIPVNISLHHSLTFRPARILWSVMPMGADWCYTMVYLLGGEFAARLLNFAMLLLLEALIYVAVRRWVTPAIAFVILALFASTSIVQLVTGSLFVENFLAAMVVGMAVATWRFGETGKRRWLYTAAVLGGTALAIKLGGLAYIIAILPFAAIEVRRQWRRLGARPALACGMALALLLAAALPAYAIAWRMTGNPLFPFLNQRFPSPILDHAASFADPRFTQPLTLRTPFDLTFHSDRYYEGRPGSLGFQYLLLAPLGLLAVVVIQRRAARCAAIVSLVGGLIVLELLPNARYLYPSLPLLLVPLAALLGWLAPGGVRRAIITLAVACVLLNTWFLPSSNFYHGDFYEQAPLSSSMRQVYIHKSAPMREIGEYMNSEHPGAPVILTNSSELSAFNAEVYINGWHQYGVWERLQGARTPLEVYSILNRWNVHYVAAPKPGYGVTIQPRSLQDLLNECATPEYQSTNCYLARLDAGCPHSDPAKRAPLLVRPGIYDDFDPAIVFDGPWIHNPGWPQARSHTLTYANLPGAKVSFAFQGGLLAYVYTKAANRGMADIAIDGVHKASLDLYSLKTQWGYQAFFKLDRGRHLAVITILPDKNPQSSDRFVDVDAFEVQ